MWRVLLAAWLALVPAWLAWADGVSVPGPPAIGKSGSGISFAPKAAASGGGGGGAPIWGSFANAQQTNCSFATTCTTSASLTVPSGFVVVGVIANNQSASTGHVSAVAVNTGCSGSLSSIDAVAAPTGTIAAAVYAGTLTGGTCTITITFSVAGSLQNMAVAVGLLSNLNSTTAGATCDGQSSGGANPYVCSGSLTVSSGGFGICAFGYNSTTALTSSNQTIDSTLTGGTGSSAQAIGLGHITATATPAFAGDNFVYAAIACGAWR